MNRTLTVLAGAAATELLASACSGLLGLGDFKDVADGGVSGSGGGAGASGGASGSGGTSGTSGAGGTSGSGGTAGASGSAGGGGSAGATVACEGGAVIECGGTCVNIATDGANCGKCGHDCGGGICDKGVCQPVVVVDSLTKPVFDVDAAQLYYGDSAGNTIAACPKGGCVLQPTQLASVGAVYAPDARGILLVSGGELAFLADPASHSSRPSFFVCDINGCPADPASVVYGYSYVATDYALSGGDAYWGFYKGVDHSSCVGNTCTTSETIFSFGTAVDDLALSADGTNVYFVSPAGATTTTGNALESCPASGACSAPTVLYGSAAGLTQTVTVGNTIYMLFPGSQGGYPNGSIQSCPTTGTCTPTTLLSKLPHPTVMAVDKDGIYWFNFDPPANGAASQIAMCPLSGCTSGPRMLAANQTGTTALHTDDKFVYWATDTQILRVAK